MVANESISLNLTEASDKDALFPPLYSINTWMNSHISNTVMTRIQLLPNLLPLNYLFYTDDLVLICTSAAGLQNKKNLLHTYSEKWLLKINLKKQKP